MDKRGKERRRTFLFGDVVRTPGIYVRAGDERAEPRHVALAIGEHYPPAASGWHLEKRISVRRPAIERPPVPVAQTRPILLDEAAMEYALEVVHRGAWNAALRTLEAKILANGKGGRAHVLEIISELRIRRTIAGSTEEGDPDDE